MKVKKKVTDKSHDLIISCDNIMTTWWDDPFYYGEMNTFFFLSIKNVYVNNLFVLKERHSFRMHDNDTYLIFIPILVLSSFRTSCCFSHNYLKSKEIQMFISKCYISCQDFFKETSKLGPSNPEPLFKGDDVLLVTKR